MAPRTRRSQQHGPKGRGQMPSDENSFNSQISSTSVRGTAVCPSPNATPPNPGDQPSMKCTLSATDLEESLSPANPTNTAKRARKIGTNHGQLMPLELMRENEIMGIVGPQDKGKGKLRCTSSYYPGHGDNTHLLAHCDPDYPDTETEDNAIETEEDWMGDDTISKGRLSKFSESIANERPLWKGIGDASTSSLSNVNSGGASSTISVDTHQDVMASAHALLILSQTSSTSAGSSGTIALPAETPTQQANTWPTETNLLIPTGSESSKLMLRLQHPLIRKVIQDLFKHIQAYLVFTNTFPNSNVALTFARDALTVDNKYFKTIASLPHGQICRFRSKVKDYCCAISLPVLQALGNAADISRHVQTQLANYNYIFPFTASGTPRRTQPYRNDRIISTIRDIYFAGGSMAFNCRFQGWFPNHQGTDGVTHSEAPLPMLALVVTVLYATLHEWCTGKHQLSEFSANVYLDVYNGHVNTLNMIGEKQEEAYHTMTADIYSRASTSPDDGNTMISEGVAVADLELENLED